jgi:integrase
VGRCSSKQITQNAIDKFILDRGKEIKRRTLNKDIRNLKTLNCPFSQYRWTQIREKLGLRDFKFHDLRKTFGSVLAQNGIFTAVIQRLLEHSSPNLTNKVYTNVDPVLRHAVNTMPASDWL